MTGSLNLAAQASQTLRFAAGLARFLRTPLTASASHDLIARNLAARQANFLSIVEHAVYQRPHSPYRRLLAHAGIERGDLRAMVAADGLEGTLERLYDAGVHVRLDEFKGREPIRRGSLAFNAGSHDFDNPLAAHHISGRSGGSRSTGTRIRLDLAHYAQDAAYEHCLLEAHGLFGRPYALWRPAPPWTAGLKGALSHMKLGHSVARWFAQQPLTWRGPGWHHALIARTAGAISRAAGRPLPSPEHVPLDEAWRVAAWLAEQVAAGRPALLNTNPASGVRACLAAVERGFDIAGTVLRVDGEPLTPGKAAAIGKAGARAVGQYGMSEIGRIGGACAQPAAVDDVHILSDKIALIRRPPRTDIGAVDPRQRLHHAAADDAEADAERRERRLWRARRSRLRLHDEPVGLSPSPSLDPKLGEADQRRHELHPRRSGPAGRGGAAASLRWCGHRLAARRGRGRRLAQGRDHRQPDGSARSTMRAWWRW